MQAGCASSHHASTQVMCLKWCVKSCQVTWLEAHIYWVEASCQVSWGAWLDASSELRRMSHVKWVEAHHLTWLEASTHLTWLELRRITLNSSHVKWCASTQSRDMTWGASLDMTRITSHDSHDLRRITRDTPQSCRMLLTSDTWFDTRHITSTLPVCCSTLQHTGAHSCISMRFITSIHTYEIHTYECYSACGKNEPRRLHEWVMSHTWMSHITYACYSTCVKNQLRRIHEWVMSHTWMSHVTHMNESWDLSHIWRECMLAFWMHVSILNAC